MTEPGAIVQEEELSAEHREGFAQAAEIQRDPLFKWAGTFPLPDARGEVQALHVRVNAGLTFIPEDPRTKSAAAYTAAWVLVIMGGIVLMSAWGFSASVPEFPREAFLPLMLGGTITVASSIALFWYDHASTRRRMEQVATDGIYVFPDAVLSRTDQGVQIFPRDSIVSVESGSQRVMAGTGPVNTRDVYFCDLHYRKADGNEDIQRFGLAFPGSPHPIVPVLKRQLRM